MRQTYIVPPLLGVYRPDRPGADSTFHSNDLASGWNLPVIAVSPSPSGPEGLLVIVEPSLTVLRSFLAHYRRSAISSTRLSSQIDRNGADFGR